MLQETWFFLLVISLRTRQALFPLIMLRLITDYLFGTDFAQALGFVHDSDQSIAFFSGVFSFPQDQYQKLALIQLSTKTTTLHI